MNTAERKELLECIRELTKDEGNFDGAICRLYRLAGVSVEPLDTTSTPIGGPVESLSKLIGITKQSTTK